MNFNELLSDLKCCMTNVPEHFVRQQIILACGDPVCADCVKFNVEFKCARCGQTNKCLPADANSNSNNYVSKITSNYIQSNLNGFSAAILDRLEGLVNEIKGNANDKINKRFEEAKAEVEEKIKGLKAKLDGICEALKVQLDDAKGQVQRWRSFWTGSGSLLCSNISLSKPNSQHAQPGTHRKRGRPTPTRHRTVSLAALVGLLSFVFCQRSMHSRNKASLAAFFESNAHLLELGTKLGDLKKLNVKVTCDGQYEWVRTA
jgi:hypothetical protein